MSYWLSKRRKADLVELCEQVGIVPTGLKKPELEAALQVHLEKHYDELVNDQTFASYYESLANARAPKSPVKFVNPPGVEAILPEGNTRVRRRTSRYLPGPTATASSSPARQTPPPSSPIEILDSPASSPHSTKALISSVKRTSRAALNTALDTTLTTVDTSRAALDTALDTTLTTIDTALTTLPSSDPNHLIPSLIEHTNTRLLHRLRTHYTQLTHPLTTRAESLRAQLSTVPSVAAVVALYELSLILNTLLPRKLSFNPWPLESPQIGAIRLPDLFLLFSGEFWKPFVCWAVTSHVVPMMGGYFFNLTFPSSPSSEEGHEEEEGVEEDQPTPATRRGRPRKNPLPSQTSPKPITPPSSLTSISTPSSAPTSPFDPFTYALTRALLSYLIYYKGYSFFGFPSEEDRLVVELILGREGFLIGAGMVGVVAVWGAVVGRMGR